MDYSLTLFLLSARGIKIDDLPLIVERTVDLVGSVWEINWQLFNQLRFPESITISKNIGYRIRETDRNLIANINRGKTGNTSNPNSQYNLFLNGKDNFHNRCATWIIWT